MSNISNSGTINIRVNNTLKDEATKLFNELGLNMSTAINIFLTQSVKEQAIPFEIKNPKPSRRLKKALKEASMIESGKIKAKSYNNFKELVEDLDN